MPLIEGLGDEVTVIFGCLLVVVVLLIAWISTHTRDIPFFSVIVVELSQRGSRNNRSQANAASEGHVESTNQIQGTTSSDEVNRDSSEIRSVETQNFDSQPEIYPVENGEHVEESILPESLESNFRNGESVTADSSENSSPSSCGQNLDCQNERIPNEERENNSESAHHVDLGGDNSSVTSPEAGEKTSTVSSEELRRRRVAFFQNQNKSSDASEVVLNESENSQTERRSSDTSQERDSVNLVETGQDVPTTSIDSESVNTNQSADDTLHDLQTSQIRIRLKYFNDTQRLVYSNPLETVGQFRRAHFSTELANNKLVRFIFNGQDLRNDTNTLQAYNVVDNSVIHCMVTQNLRAPPPGQQDHGDGDLQLGSFMFPLFGLILGALWYLRFVHRQYFNAMSTISLAGVSFLFVLGYISSWRGRRQHQHLD